MLGVMFTIHSDDKGLVIPPKLSKNKVVIVPILFDETKEKVLEKVGELKKELKSFAPLADSKEDVSPGRKFNAWELKGIPLRIEIGPKDLDAGRAVVVKRNSGEKVEVKFKDLKKKVGELLEEMQGELYDAAKELLDSRMKRSEDKDEMVKFVKKKNMVSVPMCKMGECEDGLREIMPGLKTLFVDSGCRVKSEKCVVCGKKAEYFVWVGRTY